MSGQRALELGIIGWPIGHTRSPAMHRAAAQVLGIDLKYTAVGIAPAKLADAFAQSDQLPSDGFNVTVPHKEGIAPFLQELDASARDAGAVNTVVKRGKKWVGYNTDVDGLVLALGESKLDLRGKNTAILGSGGAARAAVVAAAKLGANRIVVVARNTITAQSMIESLKTKVKSELLFAAPTSDEWAEDASLLIQATSATLAASEQADEFAKSIPWKKLPNSCHVIDLVYSPLQTSVLREAKAHGLKTLNGLGMLVHQGALAFELWTGQKPPVEVMRKAAETGVLL